MRIDSIINSVTAADAVHILEVITPQEEVMNDSAELRMALIEAKVEIIRLLLYDRYCLKAPKKWGRPDG